MTYSHAVAWIDHHEAHVIHFSPESADAETLKTQTPHRHLHHKRGTVGAGHDKPDADYLGKVASALADANALLIVGPAQAKHELLHYLKNHHAELAIKVVGVETVDHPSEGELLKFARRYFVAADRMRGV